MGVRLLVAEADAAQCVGGDGGCGSGEQAPEGVGAVPGQFRAVGDLAEGRLDAVAPLGDGFPQDGGPGPAAAPGTGGPSPGRPRPGTRARCAGPAGAGSP